MTKLLEMSRLAASNRAFIVEDDFFWFISPHFWTATTEDSGTCAYATSTGGIVALITGATDNDEIILASTNAPFLGAVGKPIVFEANVQYAEAATNAANVAIGLSSALASNLLVDDGAGPATSFSGSLFYKVDGGTSWKVVTSNGTTQTINTTNNTAGGATASVFRIEWKERDASNCEVTFFIDGQQCVDATTLKPICHVVAYSSLARMKIGAYLKTGGARAETVSVDSIMCGQLR